MRRYTQEKSPLPVGYATRSLLIGSTRNVMRRYTQVKSPLPAGYAMKYSETLSVDTPKRKALSLLDVWRDILKHQAKINTEEKPFACGMCQDTFWNITIEDTYRRKAICLQDVRQDILKLHEKIHTRQKIYACRMCNDTFWNVRQKTHKRKACWMYDKTFVNRTDQKCHKKMCTGEKPYACGMCNETFVNWTDQKCHAKIPTGEKPFASMMCECSEMSQSTTKWNTYQPP